MFEEAKLEKLTINLPPVEIARIDMLIESGYYSSRAEFIRTAVRERLNSHQDFISKKIEQITQQPSEEPRDQKTYSGVGIYVIDNKEFENAIKLGIKMKIRVIGMLKLTKDVNPEFIEKAVDSVKIYGVVRAPKKVKEALQKKMERS